MNHSLTTMLSDHVVVFDGAMGTELYNKHQFINICFEELCLSKPHIVKEIHHSNIQAGADVITTNSFGANRYKLLPYLLHEKTYHINKAAAQLAYECITNDQLIAGSVGPLGSAFHNKEISTSEAIEAFEESIQGLSDGGANFVLLESFNSLAELELAITAAQKKDMAYIASISISQNSLTRSGDSIPQFYDAIKKFHFKPLMIGFNCGLGPKQLLENIEQHIHDSPYPVLVQPNAGTPQMINDRLIYMTSPEYLSTYATHFVQIGVKAVGGCCGTNDKHIKTLAQNLKSVHHKHITLKESVHPTAVLANPLPKQERSRLARRLVLQKWVATVELVPPLGWDLAKLKEKATICYRHGVDAINIPDGPRASARMSPVITANTLQHEVGIETILHLTCRDKSVIGMQSELLGCAAVGINNLLIITGDPPKLGDYPFSSAVFDLDSIGLTKVAARLNHGIDIGEQAIKPPTSFLIGVGADPTHLDQERELNRCYQKIEAGADFIITQPTYDPDSFLAFIEPLKHTNIPIIAGCWPLLSLKNAEFLNNEIPGVTVPKEIMKKIGKATNKSQARKIGIEIALQIIAQIKPYVAGIQVSTPFGNVTTALTIIEHSYDL